MAVTGVFAADFSAFDKAVQGSTKNLEAMEGAGEQVESSLRLMTQSQEQLLNKIGASGGKIQDLGESATQTSSSVTTLSQSYRQFDGVLQAAGVNIGPQVKGLEDIAAAAGKSATQIGALGTAGLVVGAAMTGWNIGRAIADFFDLDEAISNATAKLMGWGDLAAQTAGAQQDTINRALEMGAKAGVTYTQAIKFIEEQTKKNAEASINWRERLADAHREVRNLSDAQKDGIAIMQEANATTEQITTKYGISATALEILAGKQRDAAAATAEHRKEQEALDAAYSKLMSDTKNANQLAIMEADAAKMKVDADQKRWESTIKVRDAILKSAEASNAAAKFEQQLVVEQGAVEQSNQELIASFSTMADAHTEAGAAAAEGTAQTVQGYQAVQQQVEITSDGVKGWLALMAATNRANAILNENSLFTTGSQLNRVADVLSGGGLGGTSGAFAPSFASGIENFGGGLAKVHGGEVLANLPPGTSVFPRGQGLGANISNVFNLVDSESNLARKVSELIMRQIRAGTQLGTA